MKIHGKGILSDSRQGFLVVKNVSKNARTFQQKYDPNCPQEGKTHIVFENITFLNVLQYYVSISEG